MVIERDAYCEKKDKNPWREKCEKIHPIEKSMANKEAYEKSGVPNITLSTGMKCRVFLEDLKLYFKKKIVCFKANEYNRVFHWTLLNKLI